MDLATCFSGNKVTDWATASVENTRKLINRSNSASDCFKARGRILSTSAKLALESFTILFLAVVSTPVTFTLGWFATCKSEKTPENSCRAKLANKVEFASFQLLASRVARLFAVVFVSTVTFAGAFTPWGSTIAVNFYEKAGLVRKAVFEKESNKKAAKALIESTKQEAANKPQDTLKPEIKTPNETLSSRTGSEATSSKSPASHSDSISSTERKLALNRASEKHTDVLFQTAQKIATKNFSSPSSDSSPSSNSSPSTK